MTESYVLDESVAYCAATGKNEQDADDYSSLDLIGTIFDRCHTLVLSGPNH